MKFKAMVPVLVVAAFLTAGFAGAQGNNNRQVKVPMQEQNKSGQHGEVTLKDLGNGKTEVTISLTGKSYPNSQPVHIHNGSCQNLGDIKYPLTAVKRGSSKTELNTPLADLLQQPFAVNVHKSASEVNVYTACGDNTMIK